VFTPVLYSLLCDTGWREHQIRLLCGRGWLDRYLLPDTGDTVSRSFFFLSEQLCMKVFSSCIESRVASAQNHMKSDFALVLVLRALPYRSCPFCTSLKTCSRSTDVADTVSYALRLGFSSSQGAGEIRPESVWRRPSNHAFDKQHACRAPSHQSTEGATEYVRWRKSAMPTLVAVSTENAGLVQLGYAVHCHPD
jgi:hypothetical protein